MRLRTSTNTETNQSKCTATLLQPCAPDTSEARVGEQSGHAEKLHSLRARTSPQTSLECLQRFVLIIAQTCQHVIMPKHATNMLKGSCQCLFKQKATQGFKAKENEGTLKETKFPLDERAFVPFGSSRSRALRGWSGETLDNTPCPSTGKCALGCTSREILTSGAPELGRCSPSRETRAVASRELEGLHTFRCPGLFD